MEDSFSLTIRCFAVYTALYWRRRKGCHFFKIFIHHKW